MELDKKYRERLVIELSEYNIDLSDLVGCIDRTEDEDMRCYYDTKIFLTREIIKVIEKAIIDNEIDY